MSDGTQQKTPMILIVDDEIVVRTTLRSLFEAEGFRTTLADGPAGLSTFIEALPDLVVLDQQMPSTDGNKLLRELRCIPGGEHVPVVMLIRESNQAKRAMDAGATDVVCKLSNLDSLVGRVKCLLPLGMKMREVAGSAARATRALRIARLGSWEWDPVDGKVWLSDEAARIFRVDSNPQPVSYQSFLAQVYAPDRQMVDTRLKRAVQQKSAVAVEFRIKRPNGGLGSVSLKGQGSEAGVLPRLDGVIVDMTEQKQSDDRLRLLREAIDSLPIGITLSDLNGKIIYANPAEAELHGMTMMELLTAEAGQLAPPRFRRTLLHEQWNTVGLWRRESVNVRKNGEEFPVHLSSIAVRDPEGRCIGIVTTCEDIANRKQAEQRMQRLAYYDVLTELPNRWMFQDRLQQALAFASREGRLMGLLFLDLDNFKDINDTEGHDFGDKVLREVGKRLNCCKRDADTLARIGGDEFVVILAALADQESAAVAAQRIHSQFVRPLVVDGRHVYVGMSIGIAVYPDDANDAEGILKCADTAMYQAKREGKRGYRFFSRDLNESIMRRVAIENALHEGFDREEFFLHYQPRWALRTGSMVGAEALLRWQSRDFGLLQPAEFIPLAEKSGLLSGLGEWVLRTACHQANAWAGNGMEEVRVGVNVSAQQFRQRHFLKIVDGIIGETGADPHRLEFDFTESVLMEDADKAIVILSELKKRGIRLSIDNFGTGYSSLSYLKQFPVDRLKIDGSFLTEITCNSDDATIIGGILSLAKSLNVTVVAEGVETGEQLEFLTARGCDEIQGFYLARPMTPEEIPSCSYCGPSLR